MKWLPASFWQSLPRRREPELMDDPSIDPAEHDKALCQLARLNTVSRTARSLFGPIRRLVQSQGLQTVRVLDVACGAGDVARSLHRQLIGAGISAEVAGCDLSETAVAHAAERARAVHFFKLDALHDPLPTDCDVITSCLFLHHLDEDETVHLLSKMMQAARHMVLISDLLRNRFNLGLTYAVTRSLSRSPVVRHDSMASIRAAYTLGELRQLAGEAGMHDVHVHRHWAARYLLRWERNPE